MHECLAPLKLKYRECKWYGKRSAHICFRCGYCYSCHAKGGRDREEKDASDAGLNWTDIESLPLSG